MITAKIDVKKILKDELYQGEKGTYLELVMYANTDDTGAEVPDQYGNTGVIKQGLSKSSREAGVKPPILGNYKFKEQNSFASKVKPANAFQNRPKPAPKQTWDDEDDGPIPF
jgi:hypothetical protein